MQKRDLYYERIPTKLLRDDVKYLGNILGKVIKEQEGIKFCSDILRTLAKIPGISGAHIIASNTVLNIPEAISLANL